jgi:transcriptional regulator with XRE-family HTH domain
MAKSEERFINLCKTQIEQKFSFGLGRGYTQKDLEILCSEIETKTGVVISLSTIKRIWKGDYKQSPQLATLNALAALLDYKDWKDFKSANKDTAKPSRTISQKVMILVAGGAMVLSLLILNFATRISTKSTLKPIVKGHVAFEASKTVTAGIPNTVIFKYDISNVVADSFYIQQSWNWEQRVALDPKETVLTSIYYESGFHKARLIANDSVIATQPIHIISNGWEPHIYRSDSDPEIADLKNERFISNGQLHIDRNTLVRRNIDFTKRFHTRITNSQPFNLHSDNFKFSTRLKADSVFHELCPWIKLVIVTDVSSFSISWTGKGCETKARYKVGEVIRSGSNNDLSALGGNLFEWQDLELIVENRKATIYLNGQPAYHEDFRQNSGNIMALIYMFDGTGSIDHATLKDGNDEVVFRDSFDE